MSQQRAHTWKFFRSGGLDQVLLETDADLRHLHELDPKLWVALSCPVKGLELSENTLALIDADKDGRIRVPEVLEAITWAGQRLRDLSLVLSHDAGIPLAALRDDTDAGKTALASARQILANLGKDNGPQARIQVSDTADKGKIFAGTSLNGDGIVTAKSTDDAFLQGVIADIVATLGGEADRSGLPGVNQAKVESFFTDLSAHAAWAARGNDAGILVAGDSTADALAALQAVRAKIEDYFARARVVAFDKRAEAAVNKLEADFAAVAQKELKASGEEWAAFPLAIVTPGRALPLTEGINPAWAGALASFKAATVAPLLGAHKDSLTPEEWASLCTRLAAYESWLAGKPGAAVEKLGLDRIQTLLASDARNALLALIERDKAVIPQTADIDDLERLCRYQRDLGTLLRNFVNFADFYDPKYPATFQAGTLFLDSRACDLCIRVDGPSPLAAMSKAFIAYCDATRPGASMKIAACFTQGDSDFLFVGRHGIFYDRDGRDWDAVITSVVENPISIREAFLSPYKRFLRMIEEQVAKRAAAAEAASNARVAGAAEATANVDRVKPVEPPKKVDVGTVAAIGVAITGAISALTLILGYVFGMKAWQYPLAFLGIVLVISGPSMIIAWLKLRQRMLGPILDATGWAVNGRVKINIPLGTSLTHLKHLPAGAIALRNDPFEDRDAKRRRNVLITLLLALAVVAALIRWDRVRRGHYCWQPAPVAAAPAAPVAPPTTPPATTTP
ncbi:hypothetical protein [Nibricoccus sp. IMCC34717]|uniref:hypothetical protein n=1 Tax=Nibricoccus sp. IMCC34717 TaxID=3034021 RepID=UPI00384CFB5E